MMLAAKRNTPIQRLVLNDVGPLVPWPALLRLKLEHSGADARFADLAEVEQHVRKACTTFGPLDDARWRDVALHSSRRVEDGTYALAFDPGIVNAMRHGANQDVQFGSDFLFGVDLWPVWNAVQCPTLVLRGGESDLLLPSTSRKCSSATRSRAWSNFRASGTHRGSCPTSRPESSAISFYLRRCPSPQEEPCEAS